MLFGIEEQAQGGAILDRPARVQPFGLAKNFATGGVRCAPQANQRRAPHGGGEVGAGLDHAGSVQASTGDFAAAFAKRRYGFSLRTSVKRSAASASESLGDTTM